MHRCQHDKQLDELYSEAFTILLCTGTGIIRIHYTGKVLCKISLNDTCSVSCHTMPHSARTLKTINVTNQYGRTSMQNSYLCWTRTLLSDWKVHERKWISPNSDSSNPLDNLAQICQFNTKQHQQSLCRVSVEVCKPPNSVHSPKLSRILPNIRK